MSKLSMEEKIEKIRNMNCNGIDCVDCKIKCFGRNGYFCPKAYIYDYRKALEEMKKAAEKIDMIVGNL